MQDQITKAQLKLKHIIQQKENVEAVLLQYQSGIINSHTLYENYHNLTIYINELNQYVREFRDESDRSRSSTAAKDALYYQCRRLNEQILTQLGKVQDLSNRVKDELNRAKHNVNNISNKQQLSSNWEKFDENKYQDDPLVDITTDKSKLQLQQNEEPQVVQEYNDMYKLESEILQINEMFTSLAGFVHEQGDMTDRIEANVEIAHSQVDSANSQLGKAVTHKQSARRKKIICCIILVLALLVLALIIYLSVRN